MYRCYEKNLIFFSSSKWSIDSETVQWLADISDGDARIALNSLQMAVESKTDCTDRITLNDIKDSIKACFCIISIQRT